MTEEDSKYLAEKMGLCWHEFRVVQTDWETWKRKCIHCDCDYGKNPDFSSEHGFFVAWNWAKEQEWWDTFITQEEKDIGVSSIAFEVDWVGDKEEYINTK